MRLEAACDPVFARHETFHPRYGWVKKAFDAAANRPQVFNDELAVVELGVGKNMVKSIRYWGQAFRVLSPVKTPESKAAVCISTPIGQNMFADDGWDPYCELPGTLWLLHWWLVAPGSIAPVWWLALTEFGGVEFTAEQLEQYVLDRTSEWAHPHPSAVKKDISCFLRMYAAGHALRATFDDLIDCPFRDLGLLQPSGASSGAYRYWIGPKPTLSPAVAAFACLDFIARTDSSARTATVSKLTTEHGSPGKAFKLTEAALMDLLEEASQQHEEIELTAAAGVPQLAFFDDPASAATDLLRDHYRFLIGNARFPGSRVVAGRRADLPLVGAQQLEISLP